MSKTTDKVIEMAEELMHINNQMNSQLKTENIKGKPYVNVTERIKAFIAYKYNYKLETVLLQFTEDYCVFKAIVTNENNEIVSTGHAHELQGNSYINNLSYVENCETSAIGRALGFIGIGIDTSIASANEVRTAIKNQDRKIVKRTTLNGDEFKRALKAIEKGDYTKEKLKKEYNLNTEQINLLKLM
jgi:hypothetical protein|tara:strand:- start:10047 stop:10607 length:561 start_codon:yes stop_codon:yes gene_type:complete